MICALNGLITGDTPPAACIPDDEPHSSQSDLLSITHPSPFRGRTGFQFTCGRRSFVNEFGRQLVSSKNLLGLIGSCDY